MENTPPSPGDGLCECGCGQQTPLAKRTWPEKDWVKDRPLRFCNGHNKRKYTGSEIVRDPDTGCWLWQHALQSKGYGVRKGTLAHRYYYEQKFGPIPAKMEIHHKCNVKHCVNPDHLEVLTKALHMETKSNVKVNRDLVVWIREAPSSMSSREIARQLGLSHTCVADIRKGRRWTHIV